MAEKKMSLVKHLFNRQTGVVSAKYEASRSDMVRSIERVRPVQQLQHHLYTEAQTSGSQQQKDIAGRHYIARLRFNKPGNLVGTSYWSHDSIELWNWQENNTNQKLPVPTLMGCSIVRFDWLYSNPESHIVALGKYGDLKLIDLRQQMAYDLLTGQRCANMAYGLHPQIPYSIYYGLRTGIVRNFDIRRGPIPEDTMLKAKNDDGTPFQIFSLKINPANCNEFAVAGSNEEVRLYDRRKINTPYHTMYMTTYPGLRTTKPGKYDLCGEQSYITNERRIRRWNLQEMTYNHNGSHLALSCGYDSIYLFDTSMRYPIGSYSSNALHTDAQGITSSVTASVVYGLEYFGRRSEFMIGMARGYEHTYHPNLKEYPAAVKRTSMYIWDSFTQKLVRRIPLEDRNWNFAVHPHLPIISSALDQKGIQMWSSM